MLPFVKKTASPSSCGLFKKVEMAHFANWGFLGNLTVAWSMVMTFLLLNGVSLMTVRIFIWVFSVEQALHINCMLKAGGYQEESELNQNTMSSIKSKVHLLKINHN